VREAQRVEEVPLVRLEARDHPEGKVYQEELEILEFLERLEDREENILKTTYARFVHLF